MTNTDIKRAKTHKEFITLSREAADITAKIKTLPAKHIDKKYWIDRRQKLYIVISKLNSQL